MVSCSAPARICLVGEHAIVYGYPALAAAIDLRAYARVEAYPKLVIQSDLGQGSRVNRYVYTAFKKFSQIAGVRGALIQIRSQIPSSSGLGSSAAVTIAALQGLNLEFGAGLSLEQIAKLGHSVELAVQGRASPMDTYTVTHGGAWLIPQFRKLSPRSDPKFILAISSKRSSTKAMVAKLAQLRSRSPRIDPLLRSLGMLAELGAGFLESGNLAALGRIMDIAHSILGSIGVSNRELDSLAELLREHCYGAKLTGAGGGGCMIGLARDLDAALERLRALGIRCSSIELCDRGVCEEAGLPVI